MAVTINLGSVGAMSPAMTASGTGNGTDKLEIRCGFMPSRVSIVLDHATTDMMLEYVEGLTGYFKVVTAAATIETPVLISKLNETTELSAGFSIDTSQEGAGTYYIAAWR